MKKLLLLLTLLCTLFSAVQATEVTIGDPTATSNTTSTFIPFYTLYNYGWTQQIYTADEIGQGGTINSLTMWLYNTASDKIPFSVNIYMLEVDKESFSSTSDWVAVSADDLVYSGTLNVTNGSPAQEYTFTLDNPFVYGGSDNLLIAVANNTGSYKSGLTGMVFGETSDPYRAMYAYRDASAYDIAAPGVSGTRLAKRQVISLDITAGGGGPTCDKPSSISVSDLTYNSATLTWADGSGVYNVQYKAAGDTVWTVLITEGTELTYALTGLEGSTNYTARVQSYCSALDTVSGWRSTSFTTPMAPMALPLDEQFKSSAVPANWSRYTGLVDEVIAGTAQLSTTTSGWSFTTGQGVFDTHARIYIASTGVKYWLVTPVIALEHSPALTFDLALTKSSGTLQPVDKNEQMDDRFIVLITTDNGATWTILREWNNQGSEYIFNNIACAADGEHITIDLAGYNGAAAQIAFYGESTVAGGTNYLHIDNVNVDYVPTCFTPTDLAVSDLSKTNATISWTANTGETTWIFEYKKSADKNWQSLNITENPYALTDLDPYTDYDVRVAALCDPNDELGTSRFSEVLSFKTAAGIPFIETFDDALPTGWNRYNCWLDSLMENPDNHHLEETTGGWTVGNGNGVFVNTDNHLKINIYGTSCNRWIVTPFIAMENNVQLTFDLALTKYSGNLQPVEADAQLDDKFYVLITADGGETWEELIHWDNQGSPYEYNQINCTAEGQIVRLDLSAYAGTSIALAFYGESSATGGDNNLHIDNVRVDYIPNCANPSGLVVSGVTASAATFSWDEAEEGVATWAYGIIANPSDSIVITDADFTATTTNLLVTIDTLTENTPYIFFLRRDCGGASSEYIARRFLTEQTPAALPYEDGFEEGLNWILLNGDRTNKWVLGEATNNGGTHSLYISNDNGASNKYTNNSGMIVYATKTFDFAETGVYAVSFDWKGWGEGNYDLLCVALVPEGTLLEPGTASGTWSLPAGWIALHEGAKLNLDSAEWSHSYKELNVEDAGIGKIVMVWRNDGSGGSNPPAAVDNFKVERLACPTPSALAEVEETATSTSIQVDWTANAGESYWLVQYKKAADTIWTYVADSVNAHPLTISGLEPSSTYNVRVAAWCDPTDSLGASEFSAPITVATACEAIASFPYGENFDAVVGTTSGSTNVLPICWNYINNTTYSSYSGYPQVYKSTTYANSGENSLKFYSYAYSATYDAQDQIAVLPEMQGISALRLKFNARAYSTPSSSYDATFVVGVMTDPEDPTSFVAVSNNITAPSTTYAPYEVKFNGYNGIGNYIAIKVFAGVEGGKYINGIYVDDVVIDSIPSCLEAEGLEVFDVTAESAKFTWTVEDSVAYAYAVALASAAEPADAAFAPATDSMTINGLTDNTDYVLYLRRVCGENFSSSITASFHTKQLPANLPYEDDFEAGNNWLFNNGTLENAWVYGEAAHNGEGTHAIYISNDNGATHAYTITKAAVVFATKAFNIPQGAYVFQYDWIANGESNYDYLRVALVPADVELTPGTSLPTGVTTSALPAGWIALDGGSKLNLSSAWATFNTGEITVAESGIYNVVLLWKDDTSGGSQTPAAIDNFSISKVACPAVSNIEVSDITFSSAVINWTPGDEEQNAWDIVLTLDPNVDLDAAAVLTVDTIPYLAEALEADTTYYLFIRSNCGDTVSAWSELITFNTASACAMPDNFALEAVSVNSATLSWEGYGQSVFNFSYSADTAAGWIDSLNVTMPFTINGLTANTKYFFKAQPICAVEDSAWSAVWYFKTAYGVPFEENFDGTSMPADWLQAQGLLSDILNGDDLTSGSMWYFGAGSNGVFDNHARINIYGTSSKHWLITPKIHLEGKVQLSFDLALTKYSGTLQPVDPTQQLDDKFVVLISEDSGESWTILRQWSNDSTAEYVYNNIACTADGEPVAIPLNGYNGQDVYIAFYGESTAAGGDNNLHLDNVLIDIIPSCLKPTGLAVSNVKDTTATFAWDNVENGAWDYAILANAAIDSIPAEAAFTTITTNHITVNNLTLNTPYVFFLRANCGEEDGVSAIIAKAFHTTLHPTALPFADDFENGNNWLLLNDTLENAWVVDTAAHFGEGTHGLYISNDGGATNAYNPGAYGAMNPTMVYATKLLDFPIHADYAISYDWKANGEGNYDFLRVALVPADVALEASTAMPTGFNYSTLPAGWIALDGGSKLNLSEEWANKSVEVEVPAGVYNLVFAWRNDNTDGNQTPGAVDNVNVAIACHAEMGATDSILFCPGETITWNEKEYNEAGVYNDTLLNIYGCDSVATLVLELYAPEDTLYAESEVDVENLPFTYQNAEHPYIPGQAPIFYSEATAKGVYVDTVLVMGENCAAVLVHTLTVTDKHEGIDNVDVLDGAHKFIYRDNLYIRYDDQLYNAEGKKVEMK